MKDLDNEIIKAKSYEDKGEVYKSYKILKKNFNNKKINLVLLDRISQNLIFLRRYDEAINYIELAQKISPNNDAIINNLAVIKKHQGKDEEAIELFKKILEKGNNSRNRFDIYNNIGIILKDQGELKTAKENFNESLKIESDNEIANYNIGNMLINEKKFKQAINYIKKSGELGRHQLLEIYYELNMIEEYKKELNNFIMLNPYHNRVAAISSFASEQLDMDNDYPLCKNPLSELKHLNIEKKLKAKKFEINNLMKEIDSINKIWEPDDTTTKNGYQTFGNIFDKKTKNIKILKEKITEEINNYKENILNKNSYFYLKWPTKISLYGWAVDLKSNGYQGSHIHVGSWLSGVFYIKIPQNMDLNEGSIEFSLKGFNYRLKKNKSLVKTIEPKKFDLVLFPSCLFHSTAPFSVSENRICIAFDMWPEENIKKKTIFNK